MAPIAVTRSALPPHTDQYQALAAWVAGTAPPSARVLDVGSGDGDDRYSSRVRGIAGCLVGVDPTPTATQHANLDHLVRPSVEQYALGLGPYASELTRSETISPDTFARLQKSYSEREICDIVWLVASEHLYNVTNRGLGIGSDELCELSPEWTKKRPRSLRGDE